MCDHCSCRTYPPIADLSRDHETILELAWAVAEDAAHDPARVDALLALLDPHVVKEEQGLYPRLVESGDLAADTRSTLEDEHAELRQTLLTGRFDRRAYYALAAHIEEEEMELFPAAMFAFEDDTWDELAALAAAQ
jgi:hemerythrin-like domain-containing protein